GRSHGWIVLRGQGKARAQGLCAASPARSNPSAGGPVRAVSISRPTNWVSPLNRSSVRGFCSDPRSNGLLRPQESCRLRPRRRQRGTDGEEVCHHDDTRHQYCHKPDRHDRDWDNSEVVGECPPYRLTSRHPQGDADDDSNKAQCRSLPGHSRGNLAIYEPQYLEKPDLSSATRHANYE